MKLEHKIELRWLILFALPTIFSNIFGNLSLAMSIYYFVKFRDMWRASKAENWSAPAPWRPFALLIFGLLGGIFTFLAVKLYTQKKSSSVKITLLLKVDLEGFEPLTSRMRTERSPNSLAFVHTLCTVRKKKSTYIRPYKMFCQPNGLLGSQVWPPSRWFSR